MEIKVIIAALKQHGFYIKTTGDETEQKKAQESVTTNVPLAQSKYLIFTSDASVQAQREKNNYSLTPKAQ